MKLLLLLLSLFLLLPGCRISVTAEKLAFTVQADEPGYLTTEDPTMYETNNPANPNPVD